MSEPALNSVAYCINPDCPRPVVRSLAAHECPTCKTTLRLSDRYLPLEQLSSHRYTATYLVYDLKAKSDAVMKVLIEPLPKAVELFQYTAKVLSSMRCPGLPRVSVKSYFLVPLRGSVHGIPCFVMELVRGRSLLDVLDDCPNGCPEVWVMEWLKQLLEALQFLHGRQLVHGNLSPENVLLRDDRDQVVLIGFGNPKAVLGVSGGDARSQVYKAGAQWQGAELNPALDLCAVGRIGIHLLTGIHPADLEDKRTNRLRWQSRSRVSLRLAEFLDRLAHPTSGSGFKSASEAKVALMALTNLREPTQRQSSPRVARQPTRRSASPSHPRPALPPSPVTVMQDVRAVTMQIPVIADTLIRLVQVMLNIAVVSAVTTAVSFWLLFYSPIAALMQQWLVEGSRSLSFSISPGMAVFSLVGMGTAWGMMNLRRDRSHYFWLTTLLGGVGYGFSWMGGQSVGWAQPELAVGRIGAIAALFLAIMLAPKRHWLIHVFITVIGTALISSLLVKIQFFRLDDLSFLFMSGYANTQDLSLSLMSAVVIFLSTLGATICAWLMISECVMLRLFKE